MLTVERILEALFEYSNTHKSNIRDKWTRDFLTNVFAFVESGKSISTNQAVIILKQADKHVTALSNHLGIPEKVVRDSITNPTYVRTPYESVSIKREVRYIGHNLLAFRFKYDPTVVNQLKRLGKSQMNDFESLRFYREYTLWTVPVTASNLEDIFRIIGENRFDYDTCVLEYLTLCSNTKTKPSIVEYDKETNLACFNIRNNELLMGIIIDTMNGETI